MNDALQNGAIQAAVIGANWGQQIRNNREVEDWSRYAARLEGKVIDYQSVVKNLNIDLQIKDSMIEMQDKKFKRFINEAKGFESNALSVQQKLNKSISEMDSTAFDLRGMISVYEELYKQLVGEIVAKGEAHRFKTIAESARENLIANQTQRFETSNNRYWMPDLKFSYVPSQKHAKKP